MPSLTDKCIVKGCENREHEGTFYGQLCAPCYRMLHTGEIKHGDTFIHKIQAAFQDMSMSRPFNKMCDDCMGFGILPNAETCACGAPSVNENGNCVDAMTKHPNGIPCPKCRPSQIADSITPPLNPALLTSLTQMIASLLTRIEALEKNLALTIELLARGQR